MIVKTKNGYQVRSEQGKPLSKDDLTRVEAETRLAEVEKLKAISKWVDKDKAKAAKK